MVTTVDELKYLMVMDQLKCKVPLEVKEHFIDKWSNSSSPAGLVKLQEKHEIVTRFRKKVIMQDDISSKKGFREARIHILNPKG